MTDLRRTLRYALAAATLSAAAGCGAAEIVDDSSARSRAVALDDSSPRQIGVLRLESVIALSGGGIGGLSGLWVSPDSTRFAAVADDGYLATGRLTRDRDGRLSGASEIKRAPLLSPEIARKGKRDNDAEELARLPDGGWLVSFERNHRLLRFGEGFVASGPPVEFPSPPGLKEAPENGGVEALAAWRDGGVLALEEGGDGPATRAWFAPATPDKPEAWRAFRYLPAADHRPSGATALPNGDALVLERRASLLGGFSVRVMLLRRDQFADAKPDSVVQGEELARLGPPGPSDNFEGVAAVPRADGDIDVYLLSDDNFSPLQNTLLVHLTLPTGPRRK